MEFDKDKAEYMGDGVYAQFDGYYVWIYTYNGVSVSNAIALERDVFNAIGEFGSKAAQKMEQEARANG